MGQPQSRLEEAVTSTRTREQSYEQDATQKEEDWDEAMSSLLRTLEGDVVGGGIAERVIERVDGTYGGASSMDEWAWDIRTTV